MSSPCGLEFAVGFAWICLFLLRRRTMKAVGSEALALSRSPPSARARAVVSGRWAKYAPRIRSSDKHSGTVRGRPAPTALAVSANEFALIRLW